MSLKRTAISHAELTAACTALDAQILELRNKLRRHQLRRNWSIVGLVAAWVTIFGAVTVAAFLWKAPLWLVIVLAGWMMSGIPSLGMFLGRLITRRWGSMEQLCQRLCSLQTELAEDQRVWGHVARRLSFDQMPVPPQSVWPAEKVEGLVCRLSDALSITTLGGDTFTAARADLVIDRMGAEEDEVKWTGVVLLFREHYYFIEGATYQTFTSDDEGYRIRCAIRRSAEMLVGLFAQAEALGASFSKQLVRDISSKRKRK